MHPRTRTLLYDGIPIDVQRAKSDGPLTTCVSGTEVYKSEFVEALLNFGVFDTYHFLWRDAFHPPPVELLERSDRRFRLVRAADVQTLEAYDDVTLCSPLPFMTHLLPLRASPGARRWCLSGVIHSLNGSMIPYLPYTLGASDLDSSDALVCSSESGKRVVLGLYELAYTQTESRGLPRQPRVTLPVIPLGTNCAAFAPSEADRASARRSLGILDDRPVVLYFGRLSHASKCDLWPLLLAIGKICHHRQMHIVVAGDDTHHGLSPLINQTASLLGLSDRCLVETDVSSARKALLFAAADVFVSPSDNVQETFGLTVCEAMAAGLPVIASDWDGYREIVEPGATGFLIETDWLRLDPTQLDTVTTATGSFWFRTSLLAAVTSVQVPQLARALDMLCSNPDLRHRFGAAGRRRALDTYDWRVVVGQYEALWSEQASRAERLPERKRAWRRDPTTYAAQDLFGHYPTYQYGSAAGVQLSQIGQDAIREQWPLEFLTSPNGICSPDKLHSMLLACQEMEGSSIADIVSTMVPSVFDDAFAAAVHLAALHKIGLLAVVDANLATGAPRLGTAATS